MLDKNELITQGLAYTAMGILVVFMILIIIMMVITAMELFSLEKKPVEKTEPVENEIQEPIILEEQDDAELVAVITAAIAALMDQNTSDFVVRSYKKVSGGAWNKAGRREMLENRF